MTTTAAPALLEKPQTTAVVPGFGSSDAFELMQRQAKALAASSLVPKDFQQNVPNCLIGLEMASRMGASPLAVLQNLYIVHGKPSWSSTFIIGAVNSGGRFTPLRFEMQGNQGQDQWGCRAIATDKATSEVCEGPWVTWQMAKAEGWVNKNGSKWQTMPELMFRYRAATFWGRLYCPEVLMGMRTADELIDITDTVTVESVTESPYEAEPEQNAPETAPKAPRKKRQPKDEVDEQAQNEAKEDALESEMAEAAEEQVEVEAEAIRPSVSEIRETFKKYGCREQDVCGYLVSQGLLEKGQGFGNLSAANACLIMETAPDIVAVVLGG